METELLVLLGASAFGLTAALFVVFKASDFMLLTVGGYRQRQSARLVKQIGRVLAVAQNDVYLKSRQLEQLTASLAAANLTLEELNSLKSKFLSMVVHDVRSPLAAIRGFSDLLARTPLNEKQLKMSRNIAASADQLGLLIRDLTDVAMIEAGKLKIEKAVFAFGDLVNALLPAIEVTASNKNISVRYDRINPGAMIDGDKFRLSQVLQNLLTNAIKFTPKGGAVEVSSRVEGKWLTVSVKDSGIGVHPSETKKIFEKFYQAKFQKDEKLRKQGWGLGLSIAHEIIMQHKGDIGATSAGLGKGSTFWFRVPVSFQPAGNN